MATDRKKSKQLFLSSYKSTYPSSVRKAISKTNLPLTGKMMKCNPYEKIVPFNLWFAHQSYQVVNNWEHNQNLRIRTFNKSTITPLVSTDNQNLRSIRLTVPSMSLYQPFYPETFYATWEFLQLQHLRLDQPGKRFLHIGREDRIGTMEAVIFFHERYQHTYQYNTYHSWLSGQESYDMANGRYNLMTPRIDYLAQAYKNYFIQSTIELTHYDFVSIDCLCKLRDVFIWETEEIDLHATLFYLLTGLQHLQTGGSLLLRLNMIGSDAWSVIFGIVHHLFREHTFYRPTIINVYNSEIYLFATNFEHKPWLDGLQCAIYRNLYRSGAAELFNLTSDLTASNPVRDAWVVAVDKWVEHLGKVDVAVTATDAVDKWFRANGLWQIKDLKPTFVNRPTVHLLKTGTAKFALKPLVPAGLYRQPFYTKLIEKRAELNYFKRIMDTKPSQIFMTRRDKKWNQGYLLTWEGLTRQMDEFHGLIPKLRQEFGAEMVTNAWLKLYEIMNLAGDLIPADRAVVKSFHLCEAPGAFIAAINHYVANRNQRVDWYGQTLKPTDTGDATDAALDDYFGLIAAYPDRWLFGDVAIDDSGDITHSAVIKSYAADAKLKQLDFMTADAGLHCDPTELNEQEAYLGKINMGQIVCILACLPVGKAAVFKTFLPMSEPLTISMMYLITHTFGSVSIVKPSASHSSNSEVYVVCSKYKGIKESVLEQLYVLLDDVKITSKTLLFAEIDKVFFDAYMTGIGGLIDRQVGSLTRNYYYYYHLDEIGVYQDEVKEFGDDWLLRNPVYTLNENKLM